MYCQHFVVGYKYNLKVVLAPDVFDMRWKYEICLGEFDQMQLIRLNITLQCCAQKLTKTTYSGIPLLETGNCTISVPLWIRKQRLVFGKCLFKKGGPDQYLHDWPFSCLTVWSDTKHRTCSSPCRSRGLELMTPASSQQTHQQLT
jgi:hypothetical protein